MVVGVRAPTVDVTRPVAVAAMTALAQAQQSTKQRSLHCRLSPETALRFLSSRVHSIRHRNTWTTKEVRINAMKETMNLTFKLGL